MMKHNEIKTKLMEAIPECYKQQLKDAELENCIDFFLKTFGKMKSVFLAEDATEEFRGMLTGIWYLGLLYIDIIKSSNEKSRFCDETEQL